jgi:voltage-gated potassium channel
MKRTRLVRVLAAVAVILAAYYLLPVDATASGVRFALGVAGAVVLGLAVTAFIARQVGHTLRDPDGASVLWLFVSLMGGVVVFALIDYMTAVHGNGQFVSLQTRTDALYFAMATLTTVGYGDVHAAGQLARGVVILQLVFNVGVLTTGASVLGRQISTRARGRAGR